MSPLLQSGSATQRSPFAFQVLLEPVEGTGTVGFRFCCIALRGGGRRHPRNAMKRNATKQRNAMKALPSPDAPTAKPRGGRINDHSPRSGPAVVGLRPAG